MKIICTFVPNIFKQENSDQSSQYPGLLNSNIIFFNKTTRELSYQIQIFSGDIFDLIIFQKKQLQQTFLKQLQKSEFWQCI